MLSRPCLQRAGFSGAGVKFQEMSFKELAMEEGKKWSVCLGGGGLGGAVTGL